MVAVVTTSTDSPETIQARMGDKGTVTVRDEAGNDITAKPKENTDGANKDAANKDAAPDEGKSTSDSAADGKDQGGKDDAEGKVSEKAQKRIDKLTKELNDARTQLDAAKRKPEGKDATQQDNANKDAAKSDETPKPEDFETQADYMKALSKWATKEARKEQKIEDNRVAEATRIKGVVDNWNEQVATAKAKYKDWDDVMDETPIGNASAKALVESPDGAELAYYIAKHPDEAKVFKDLTGDREIGIAIGELRAKVRGETATKTKSEENKGTADATGKKKPEPINPVGGTSNSGSTKARGDMNYQEYKVLREKEIAAKRKQA